MTNRRDVMADAVGWHELIIQNSGDMLYKLEMLLDDLLDAEDVIAEQEKRLDILESELADANTLIADLKEDIKEYRSGAHLREGWEL